MSERKDVEKFFIPKNEVESSTKTFQEGKYKLTTTQFSTKKGSWHYCQGKVFKDDDLIATINRNYGMFPYLFIIDHPNGHDYLICGEDYQGQTIIELDTGKRTDSLPEEAEKGWGFCWAEYKFDRKSQILIVNGCFWACPYEFKFYDFSDPINFKELKIEDEEYDLRDYYGTDVKWPTIDNGIIRCYQIKIDDEDDDDDDKDENEVVAYTDLIRDGDILKVKEKWVSDNEKIRREHHEKSMKEYDEKIERFKAEDPLYLQYQKELENPGNLNPEKYQSRGVTFDGWCKEWSGNEWRWCRRLAHDNKTYTIDLEWATETGPIQLEIFKNGNKFDTKIWMEHSPENISEAFEYSRNLVK